MEGPPVDKLLLDVLDVDWCNGFGFQLSRERQCLYIGRVFLAQPNKSNGYDSYEVDERILLSRIKETLGYDDIWMTDFLGRDYLTVGVSRYSDISRIIITILSFGEYKFVTHNGNSSFLAHFKPGEVYTRQLHERKLIETLRANYTSMVECISLTRQPTVREAWQAVCDFGGVRAFFKHFNYTTQEGRDFCSELRSALGKSPRSKKEAPTEWPWYKETIQKYRILQWEEVESLPKKAKKEEEEECMICMDAAPTTTVVPCGCRVVCDACSKDLKTTPDKRICVRCRQEITHVAYEKNNEMEEC